MDRGIDRKVVKGRPGIHIHFYTSFKPQTITFESYQLTQGITAEKLCVKIYRSEEFIFTENTRSRKIDPITMHLFQLWNYQTEHWQVCLLSTALCFPLCPSIDLPLLVQVSDSIGRCFYLERYSGPLEVM